MMTENNNNIGLNSPEMSGEKATLADKIVDVSNLNATNNKKIGLGRKTVEERADERDSAVTKRKTQAGTAIDQMIAFKPVQLGLESVVESLVLGQDVVELRDQCLQYEPSLNSVPVLSNTHMLKTSPYPITPSYFPFEFPVLNETNDVVMAESFVPIVYVTEHSYYVDRPQAITYAAMDAVLSSNVNSLTQIKDYTQLKFDGLQGTTVADWILQDPFKFTNQQANGGAVRPAMTNLLHVLSYIQPYSIDDMFWANDVGVESGDLPSMMDIINNSYYNLDTAVNDIQLVELWPTLEMENSWDGATLDTTIWGACCTFTNYVTNPIRKTYYTEDVTKNPNNYYYSYRYVMVDSSVGDHELLMFGMSQIGGPIFTKTTNIRTGYLDGGVIVDFWDTLASNRNIRGPGNAKVSYCDGYGAGNAFWPTARYINTQNVEALRMSVLVFVICDQYTNDVFQCSFPNFQRNDLAFVFGNGNYADDPNNFFLDMNNEIAQMGHMQNMYANFAAWKRYCKMCLTSEETDMAFRLAAELSTRSVQGNMGVANTYFGLRWAKGANAVGEFLYANSDATMIETTAGNIGALLLTMTTPSFLRGTDGFASILNIKYPSASIPQYNADIIAGYLSGSLLGYRNTSKWAQLSIEQMPSNIERMRAGLMVLSDTIMQFYYNHDWATWATGSCPDSLKKVARYLSAIHHTRLGRQYLRIGVGTQSIRDITPPDIRNSLLGQDYFMPICRINPIRGKEWTNFIEDFGYLEDNKVGWWRKLNFAGVNRTAEYLHDMVNWEERRLHQLYWISLTQTFQVEDQRAPVDATFQLTSVYAPLTFMDAMSIGRQNGGGWTLFAAVNTLGSSIQNYSTQVPYPHIPVINKNDVDMSCAPWIRSTQDAFNAPKFSDGNIIWYRNVTTMNYSADAPDEFTFITSDARNAVDDDESYF